MPTYGLRIDWSNWKGEVQGIGVSNCDSWEEAYTRATAWATELGWTYPRWWEFWRWFDSRPVMPDSLKEKLKRKYNQL
jgi:hypothetical protein